MVKAKITHHKTNVFRIQRRHDTVLRALFLYRYLTVKQTARLTFIERYVQRSYQELSAAHYVREHATLHREQRAGSVPLVYSLTPRAGTYLAAQGVPVPPRLRQGEKPPSGHHLAHRLRVIDLLISLELLERAHADLAVLSVLQEQDLKKLGVRVPVGDGEKRRRQALIPDALATVQLPDEEPFSLAFEVDLQSEYQRDWSGKVEAYAALTQVPAAEAFGEESLLIAVLAAKGGERRRDQLLYWTETTLERLGTRELGLYFAVAAGDPAVLSPEALFCTPRWLAPFTRVPAPLFPGLG